MREQRIDIFDPTLLSEADAICFTSNGILRMNDELVMGAGVAKTFRDRFPGLALSAGEKVKRNGNVCQTVGLTLPSEIGRSIPIVAFPTKYHWRNPSDLNLIVKSSRELMRLIEERGWRLVVLPRPGCSNGQLLWPHVSAAIGNILDTRVLVVYR